MITKIKRIKKRKKSKKSFGPYLFLICSLLIIGFFVYSNLRIQKKRSEMTNQIDQLQKEIEVLEEKKEQFQAGISQGLTQASLEEEARERFNLKKPGEEVVTVLPPEQEAEAPEEEKGFWNKIWQTIKFW